MDHRFLRLACLGCLAIILFQGSLSGAPALAAVTDQADTWTVDDIILLDAVVTNGKLGIQLNERTSFGNYSFRFVEFYLDADLNLNTGDARLGGLQGFDYRLSCDPGLIQTCDLFRLPTSPDGKETITAWSTVQSAGATIQVSQNVMVVWIPTSFVGGPAAVDLFAIAHRGGTSQHIWGNGDRCPDAGVLNTATGTVLVRRPAAAVDRTFSDAVGDQVNGGQDLTSVRFRTYGDQFETTLTFAAPINLDSLSYNLSGWIVLDSDQDLLSGMQVMGKTIPTWGGDVLLHYYIAQISPQLQVFLSGFTGGEGVPFGPPTMSNFRGNDGRWYVNGDQLIIASSLAVLDAWDLSIQGTANVMQRKPTIGEMIAGALTTNSSGLDADLVPSTGGNFFDLKSGQDETPLIWNVANTISQTDPAEFGAISGMDLTQVDVETIDARLVVKGTLSRWDMTDYDTIFQIFLDTDLNASTGQYVVNPHTSGTPAIGAEYEIMIYANDQTAVVYHTRLFRPDGVIELHNAILDARPSSGPASFTVTIPLQALGNPAALRLYLTTGAIIDGQYARFDVAPPSAFMIGDEPSGQSYLLWTK